jgi:hypothetical protein
MRVKRGGELLAQLGALQVGEMAQGCDAGRAHAPCARTRNDACGHAGMRNKANACHAGMRMQQPTSYMP